MPSQASDFSSDQLPETGGDPSVSPGVRGFHDVGDDPSWVDDHLQRTADLYRRSVGSEPHPVSLLEFASIRADEGVVSQLMRASGPALQKALPPMQAGVMRGQSLPPTVQPVGADGWRHVFNRFAPNDEQKARAADEQFKNEHQPNRWQDDRSDQYQQSDIQKLMDEAYTEHNSSKLMQDLKSKLLPTTKSAVDNNEEQAYDPEGHPVQGMTVPKYDLQQAQEKNDQELKRATDWLVAKYHIKTLSDLKGEMKKNEIPVSDGEGFNETDVRNAQIWFTQQADLTQRLQEKIQQQGYGNGMTPNGVITPGWEAAMNQYTDVQHQKEALKQEHPILAPFLDEAGMPDEWMHKLARDIDPRYGGMIPGNLFKVGLDLLDATMNKPMMMFKRMGTSISDIEDDPVYNQKMQEYYRLTGQTALLDARRSNTLVDSVLKGADAISGFTGRAFQQQFINGAAVTNPEALAALDAARKRRDEVLVKSEQEPWMQLFGVPDTYWKDPKNHAMVLATDIAFDLLAWNKMGAVMKLGKIEGLASDMKKVDLVARRKVYFNNDNFNGRGGVIQMLHDALNDNAVERFVIEQGGTAESSNVANKLMQVKRRRAISALTQDIIAEFRANLQAAANTPLSTVATKTVQQTKAHEFRKAEYLAAHQGKVNPTTKAVMSNTELEAEHQALLLKAMRKGEQIDPAILADYPALAQRFERLHVRNTLQDTEGIGRNTDRFGRRADTKTLRNQNAGEANSANGTAYDWAIGKGDLSKQEVFDTVVEALENGGTKGIKAYRTTEGKMRSVLYASREIPAVSRLLGHDAAKFLPLVYATMGVAPKGLVRMTSDNPFATDILKTVAHITRNPNITAAYVQRVIAATKETVEMVKDADGKVRRKITLRYDLPQMREILNDTHGLVEKYWKKVEDVAKPARDGERENFFGADAGSGVTNEFPMHLMDISTKGYFPSTAGHVLREETETAGKMPVLRIKDTSLQNGMISAMEGLGGLTRDIRLLNVWFNVGWTTRLIATGAMRFAAFGMMLPRSRSWHEAIDEGMKQGPFLKKVGAFLEAKLPGAEVREAMRYKHDLLAWDPITYRFVDSIERQAKTPHRYEVASVDLGGIQGADQPVQLRHIDDVKETGGAATTATFARLRDDELSKLYRAGASDPNKLQDLRAKAAKELQALSTIATPTAADAERIKFLTDHIARIDGALATGGYTTEGAKIVLEDWLQTDKGITFLLRRMDETERGHVLHNIGLASKAEQKASGAVKTGAKFRKAEFDIAAYNEELAGIREEFAGQFSDYYESYRKHAPKGMAAVDAGKTDAEVLAALKEGNENPMVRGMVRSDELEGSLIKDLKKSAAANIAKGQPPDISFGEPGQRSSRLERIERAGFELNVPLFGFAGPKVNIGAAAPIGMSRDIMYKRRLAQNWNTLRKENPEIHSITLYENAAREAQRYTDHIMLNINNMWNYEKQFRGLTFYATKRRLWDTLLLEMAVHNPGKYKAFQDMAAGLTEQNKDNPSYRQYEVSFDVGGHTVSFQMDRMLWLGDNAYLSNPAAWLGYYAQQATGIAEKVGLERSSQDRSRTQAPEVVPLDSVLKTIFAGVKYSTQGRDGLEGALGLDEYKRFGDNKVLQKLWRQEHPDGAAYMVFMSGEIYKAQTSGTWPKDEAGQQQKMADFASHFMHENMLALGARQLFRFSWSTKAKEDLALKDKLHAYDQIKDAQKRIDYLRDNPDVSHYFYVYNNPDDYAKINEGHNAVDQLRQTRDQSKAAFFEKPKDYQKTHIGELFKIDSDYAQAIDKVYEGNEVYHNSTFSLPGDRIVKERQKFRDQLKTSFPNMSEEELNGLVPSKALADILNGTKYLELLKDRLTDKTGDYFKSLTAKEQENDLKRLQLSISFLKQSEDTFQIDKYYLPPANEQERQMREVVKGQVYKYLNDISPIYEALHAIHAPIGKYRTDLEKQLHALQKGADEPFTFQGTSYPPVEEMLWGMWQKDRQDEKLLEWVYRSSKQSSTLTAFQKDKVRQLRIDSYDKYRELLKMGQNKAKTGDFGTP